MSRQYRLYCITEAASVYTYANSLPTVCPNDAAHTINADSIAIYSNAQHISHLFGNGADGNVTITSNTSLTSDMYYMNLTLASGILNNAAYRIFVAGMLTFSGGTIAANGGDAIGSAAGANAGIPAVLGGSAVGGAGRKQNGVNGGSLINGTRLGGIGGAGGDTASYLGGIGGSGREVSNSQGGLGIFNLPQYIIRGRDETNVRVNGGAGGGGGAGSNVDGEEGGGGGGGGGVVIVSARHIESAGGTIIAASGGNGANATFANTSGGGGGAGGCIAIVSNSDISLFTYDVTGGSGGASGGGTGNVGVTGGNGNLFLVRV